MQIDSTHADKVLSELMTKLGNPNDLMLDIGSYLLQKANTRFTTLIDVNGVKWKENAPATIKQKGHKIMLTGKLYPPKQTRLRNSLRVAVNRLGFELGTMLDYAKANNEGTMRIPKREFLGINEQLDIPTIDKKIMEFFK